jgi:hypothetical protein
MTATKNQNIKSWLEGLKDSNQSDERDSLIMQQLLREIGYPNAKVVFGTVYLEGRGTIESPPTSIHTIAKVILMKIKLMGIR